MANKANLFLIFFFMVCFNTSSSTSPEAEILTKFKNSLSNTTALNNWDISIDICNNTEPGKYWTGLICRDGAFFGLRLENMSLAGVIDIDTLTNLSTLRSLSFRNNSFQGRIPEVKKLGALKALYLSYNKFSGVIPDDAFQDMRSLKTIHLGENEFQGNIPSSLANLPALVELSLEGNRFEGDIPFFLPRTWTLFDVSNNQLEGPIPSSLGNLNLTSFIGNKDLCGEPLRPCKSKKWKLYVLIGVIIAITAVAVLFIYHHCCRRNSQSSISDQAEEVKAHDKLGYIEAQNPTQIEGPVKDESVKLQFVRTDRPDFDLEELLRAPAEVLGGGSFGSSYKALISNGPPVVVKRLRPMKCVGMEEFHEHMRRLGRISHPNLLPPLAFYYKDEDKLLISEFAGNGNLADHLHGKRRNGNLGLDWPTRLKIIKGVGRGLAHLHEELSELALPHGHLKSCNVLITNSNFVPLLTDFGFDPLLCTDQAQQFMAAYKSPEFLQLGQVSRVTDVWSLGILILEVLTGKFPGNYLRHGKGAATSDLAVWVKSVVREEWATEVFDGVMMNNGDGEMAKLLKIGLLCCEGDVDKRLNMKEAVLKIEELKDTETCGEDDEFYSSYSYGSEMEVRSFDRDRI